MSTTTIVGSTPQRVRSEGGRFWYQDLVDLGFKRKDIGGDRVFFEENGYEWFLLEYRLNKRSLLDWDSTTHVLELLKMGREHNVLERYVIPDMGTLKTMIRMFSRFKREDV